MMAYVLLAAIVDGGHQSAARVSSPNFLTAFVLFIVPLALAALIGAVEHQYIAWRFRALPSDVRAVAC
jgi:hypothetical protein